MLRPRYLSAAIAAAVVAAPVAHAQDFGAVISFGDSLSDVGNIAAVQGLPPGSSFTTNPDPVHSELLAEAFGLSQAPSLAGGSNYAWGGACVTSLCLNPVPGVPGQIDAYLAANGGQAQAGALHTVWGGANDVFATLALDPANAPANTQAAAAALGGQVLRLQQAGADMIVVYNLPDLGATPQFAPLNGTGAITQVTTLYNASLDGVLAQAGEGIVPINTFGLIRELAADPARYGLTNVTDPACTPANAVACGPEGSGYPATYPDGAGETYLFADGVHPSGAAHRMLANVVLATLAAPQQVALAGEAPLRVYDDHSRVLATRFTGAMGGQRAPGAVEAFANVAGGRWDLDAGAANPELDGRSTTLTVGAQMQAGEAVAVGVAASLARVDADFAQGASNETREALLSVYGVWNRGGLWAAGALSGGKAEHDIERAIVMGPSVRRDGGETQGAHKALEASAGYLFDVGATLRTGPFVSVTWQQVDVDGYREDGDSATALVFDGYERDSTVGRLGWELTGAARAGMRGFRSYARVAYAREDDADAARVVAGSKSMNGRFGRDGYRPSEDWWSADVGFSWGWSDTASLFAGYGGRFGDDDEDRDGLNLGVNLAF